MKQVTINIDWNNLDSIRAAEKTKARLETQGYSILDHWSSPERATMIYCSEDDEPTEPRE